MRAHEFISQNDLDEGIKDWAKAAGLATAIGLGGQAAYNNLSTPSAPIDKPSQVAQGKISAPEVPSVSQQVITHAKSLLSKPRATPIYHAALQHGLRGDELAQFMAQCAHETINFSTLTELGGKLDFRKYEMKYNPEKATELGNTKPGDGARFKGRGYLQITGRYNYTKIGKALGLPLDKHPELVENPEIAVQTALWYWDNVVKRKTTDFSNTASTTKPINSAMRGLEDRKNKFIGIKHVLTQK